MKTHVGKTRREQGQNLVEFALLMPVVLVIFAAIGVTAFALFTRSNLQQAVREGARQAAVGRSLADVRDLAAGNSGGSLDAADVNWCLPSGSSGKVGDDIRVFLDQDNDGDDDFAYTLIPSTGILAAFGVPSVPISIEPRATARLETKVTGVPPCT